MKFLNESYSVSNQVSSPHTIIEQSIKGFGLGPVRLSWHHKVESLWAQSEIRCFHIDLGLDKEEQGAQNYT